MKTVNTLGQDSGNDARQMTSLENETLFNKMEYEEEKNRRTFLFLEEKSFFSIGQQNEGEDGVEQE